MNKKEISLLDIGKMFLEQLIRQIEDLSERVKELEESVSEKVFVYVSLDNSKSSKATAFRVIIQDKTFQFDVAPRIISVMPLPITTLTDDIKIEVVEKEYNPRCEAAEKDYLDNNLDVKQAVEAGAFKNGYEHWEKFGQFEPQRHQWNFKLC